MTTRHEDPGLQPERTGLAWTRTAVAYSLCSAVLLRWAWVFGTPVFFMVALLLAIAATVYLTQRNRYRRQVEGINRGWTRANVTGVMIMSVSMVIFGVAALVLVVGGALR